MDAEPDTWCIDVTKITEKITSRTAAILPVHIYGHPCFMNPIYDLVAKHQVFIVEDAAEAHGARYGQFPIGCLGDIACFSFYANKIITTGEGGMLVTDDPTIAKKAKLLRNLAFTEHRYLHPAIGFNYRMTNLQAAIGLAQLARLDEFVDKKRANAQNYNKLFKDIDGITTPIEQPWATNVYWMYGILVDDPYPLTRDDLMIQLKQDGVDTRAFFIGMHRQPAFRNAGIDCRGDYPVSDYLADHGLYLPSSVTLNVEQQAYIGACLQRYAATA